MLKFFIALFALISVFQANAQSEVELHVTQSLKQWQENYDRDELNYSLAEVIEFLNLDYPGLEKVKAAYSKKDSTLAKKELLTYYRTKYTEVEPLTANTPEQDKIVEDVLQHIIKGNKNYPPAFRGIEINWTDKAVIDGKVIHSKEWLYQYHRLNWWPFLAARYTQSGENKYFNEWLYEMISHHRTFPKLADAPWFARRGMETDQRCLNYLKVLPHMIHSPEFTEDTLLFTLGTFYKNAEHIRTHYSAKGNHLIGELTQVLMNSVELAEFKKASEWKQEAMSRLPGLLFKNIYNDGMNREMVFSYHTFYIELFTKVYDIAKKHNIEHELPKEFAPLLEKMYGKISEFMLPDISLPQFGDAWKYRSLKNGIAESRYGYLLADYAKRYPHNDQLNYFARKYEGQSAPEPKTSNAFYPESGFYSFRTGWSEDSTIMILKNSVGGPWHNQADNGTFLLYANGRNFMNDSGCYIYASSDPEDQAWRQWFRETRHHQTMTLNNQTVDSKPLSPSYEEGENWMRLKISNQSYPELRHDRTIWFIKNKYFLILDEAHGSAQGDLRVHFQFNPGPCELNLAQLSAQTQFKDGNNFLVKNIPIDNNEPLMTEEEGWISYFIGHKESRLAWSYKLEKKAEKSKRFLTLLSPQNNLVKDAKIEIKGDLLIIEDNGENYSLAL